jgi:glucose-1-phosphate adenylyltransferase
MRRTIALVLAGGEGSRLKPLTRERSKPAVYFGGRYRLVDFVLSNLVNSGCMRIKVLTQYRSTSLVRHLTRAWALASSNLEQYIEPVPAAMNLGRAWFRGTADAIWQNLDLLRDVNPKDVFIFGSDHIYKMDVRPMLQQHRDTEADLTVATLPVPRSEASAFGCLHVDETGRVTEFIEKPKDPPPMPGDPTRTLVSMGNYVFRTGALISELRRDADATETSHDFGKDILATAHERMSVYAYDFTTGLCPGEDEHSRGYWRDVGTLDAYFEANMDLISVHPRLDLYNESWPVRGVQAISGPVKFVFNNPTDSRVGLATDSIIGPASIISGGEVSKSVLFHKVRLNSYSSVDQSILFPQVDVGRHAHLRRCIVDKGVRIPPGEKIGFDLEKDRERFTVSDSGIVCVARSDFGQVDEFDAVHPHDLEKQSS